MQGNRPGVKPYVVAMARRIVACRGGPRANVGAAGINRRQFFAPEGDLDVPSAVAKNGGAHVSVRCRAREMSSVLPTSTHAGPQSQYRGRPAISAHRINMEPCAQDHQSHSSASKSDVH